VPEILERRAVGADKAEQAEGRYRAALNRLIELVRKHQEEGHPLTKRRVLEYAGTTGIFRIGNHALRGVISRALEEGHVAEHAEDGARYPVLMTWK